MVLGHTAMSARQRACLRALGVPTWVQRDASAPLDDAVAPPAEGVAERDDAPPPDAPATDLESLRIEVAACSRCVLSETRTQTVFGVGDPDAACMVIGEAPGADEDRLGEPFVGRAGRLLTEMLRAIGLARDAVYIANIIKCRPPRNRDPRPAEVAACTPYLRAQIERISPQVILAVGRVAAQDLLGTSEALSRLRGREHRLPGTDLPVLVTYHPAYLLRSPREKQRAWVDLKCLRRLLDTSASRAVPPAG